MNNHTQSGQGTLPSAAIELDTPTPVVDLDIAERNIIRLQHLCDVAGVDNRPHIKTHKSVALAQLQQKHGAKGITCQKLGEAEVMANAGFSDILISFNIIGKAKHKRLVALCDRVDLTVSCDNEVVANDLSSAVAETLRGLRVLVECDTGRHRCGVSTPEAVVELAHHVARLAGLRFGGLLIYAPTGEIDATRAFVDTVKAALASTKLKSKIISAGGTPNIAHIGELGETEYRAGTYIFNDRQMVSLGAATLQDCAMFVHATVVSHPEQGRVMIDAGSKALTSDLAGFQDFGLLVDYPGARIYRLAEEHGFVDVSNCQQIPEIGEIVRVLPNHACPVSNLFDQAVLVRHSKPCGLLTIGARGRVA